jgi:class IV lanthipeptide synthase
VKRSDIQIKAASIGLSTHSGTDVVIKEARAHVTADKTGKDARCLLRVEARALDRIGPRGLAPRLIKLFEQGQHLFLAEDLVPGMALREWVPDLIRNAGWRRHVPEAMDHASRLVELMDAVPQAGMILRDFNPNNIMVLPGGELRLIDLELAVTAGEPEGERVNVGTLGYSAPEQLQGAPPAVQADYHSLGATVCFVVTGDTPYFLEEVPQGRPLCERLAEWLTVRGKALDMPTDIQMLILGLMDDVPERRWTPAEARDALAVARKEAKRSPRVRVTPTRDLDSSDSTLGEQQWRHAVDGMVNYLLTSMNPTDGERLWPNAT